MKDVQQLSLLLIFFFKFDKRQTKYLDQYLKGEVSETLHCILMLEFGMYFSSYDHWLLWYTCILFTEKLFQ